MECCSQMCTADEYREIDPIHIFTLDISVYTLSWLRDITSCLTHRRLRRIEIRCTYAKTSSWAKINGNASKCHRMNE